MKFSRLLLVLSMIAAVVAVGFLSFRSRADEVPKGEEAPRHPIVNVVVARPQATASDLTLPATLQAFQDTPIYARTTGYIQKWFFDIGDRVKAGQTLAIIEGPDLDQELNQAIANLGQTVANLNLSKISADRWKALGAQNAVAQQDVDTRLADYEARQADTKAAQANVDRLTQLQRYQNVTAPYDGVVSARNAQVGAFISPGAGMEIFHVVQTDILRVYVSVPQSYVRAVKPGLPVDVLVPEFPKQVFKGKVARFSGSLDSASRTLLVEIQLPNSTGQLFPGMFCQVHFRLIPPDPAIVLPSNAAIVRADGTLVATVDDRNHIHLQAVVLGRDFGTQIEVLDGLRPGTRVVANPSDSLTEGLEVDARDPKN